MKWGKFIQGMEVAGRSVEIRSLRLQDPLGNWRRYRTCSTDALNNRFTRKPACGRLLKDKNGRLGVAVQPRGAGFVKVGASAGIQTMIIAPLEAISRKQARQLLKQLPQAGYEQEGCFFINGIRG